jgi:hypothetical protein
MVIERKSVIFDCVKEAGPDVLVALSVELQKQEHGA